MVAQPGSGNGEVSGSDRVGQGTKNQPDMPGDEQTALTPTEAFGRPAPLVPFENASFSPPPPDVADVPAPARVLNYSWKLPLTRQIAVWLRLFIEDGQVVELRALNVRIPNGARITFSGFFNSDSLDKMAASALELTPDAEGVYFTLNPLDPSLLARRYNRVEAAKDTVADIDVTKRRWLLIDADPVRKPGISATEEEKRAAWDLARSVYTWLRDRAWPEPILADSGNGYHLLYRIDLPKDDGGLVKSVLDALAARFDEDGVKIDTKVFNPSRIVKLYGTVARKGDSLSDRPHRRTGVLAAPADVGVVTREQLEAVAGEKVKAPDLPSRTNANQQQAVGSRSDLMKRARNYLLKVPPAVAGEGGHNQTFKAACILMRFGLTEEEAMTVFQEWNERCQPPWEEKDLLKKLRDAANKVANGPAFLPGAVRTPGVVGGQGADGDADSFPGLNALEAADDPHRLAKLYLDGSRAADGEATIRSWNGDWYRWGGVVYQQVSEADVRAGLTKAIKGEFNRLSVADQVVFAAPGADEEMGRGGRRRAIKVTTTLVGNALQALKSETFVPSGIEPPVWLSADESLPAADVLVARNGLVYLPGLMDGREFLRPLTPKLFTTVALDYAIEAKTPPPAQWIQFLNALWPEDVQSVELVQEWFGYCLTQDTSQQKMLLVVGPKRSGKGTIARVLTALIGSANVAGPTLSSLASNFGLSPLLNKPVAIVPDARFSSRSDHAMIVERLLSISGEDTLTIDRKNREHLTVKLPTRLTILTNELPGLTDASAALASRLLTLQLRRSWYGEEDTDLSQKLLLEIPGIFLWAVEGLKRLRSRGRFEQPESGKEMAKRMVELSSPVTAFVQDRCELGPEKSLAKRTLFDSWRQWCLDSGYYPGNQATFGKNLMAAFPGLQVSRPVVAGRRLWMYVGIGLQR